MSDVIEMSKDDRKIKVSIHPDSIKRMEDAGWSVKKAKKLKKIKKEAK